MSGQLSSRFVRLAVDHVSVEREVNGQLVDARRLLERALLEAVADDVLGSVRVVCCENACVLLLEFLQPTNKSECSVLQQGRQRGVSSVPHLSAAAGRLA